jgi:hypothetical protein
VKFALGEAASGGDLAASQLVGNDGLFARVEQMAARTLSPGKQGPKPRATVDEEEANLLDARPPQLKGATGAARSAAR